ncbi:hypothetical protein [Ornithinibacillus scapharcae]|uniref:hypothetical protein n=1 Tax=Ornithinibacillus scapharcae TaxID=1147159 RepID=UPI000225B072|nr:hypothetical protein [Ornithinibacillus scapharcae]
MQEQKVAIEAAKEMEKSNQMPNPIDTDQVKEERELNPEITEYLEKAIDNFALELGLEDVSDFPIVVEVQTIIYDLYQSPDHVIGTDVSETKNYIDMMLTPPAAQLEKMKAPQDTEAYSLMETFGVYYNYEYHFQNYLATLLSELPIEEYDVIYELQDNPENYNGPEDIKTLLQIFNEQGYLVKKDPFDNYLVVDIDVGRLKNQLAEKGYGDAYLAYLDYYVVAHDFDWNNWKELANILIEAESLLVTYGDSYNREMRRELYNSIEQHLYSYLRYWGDVYEVSEEEKNEYYSFINNYPDTKVAQVVQSYLSEWEANDWKRTQGHSYTPEPIDLLFEYDNVNYEDIVVMGRWPFVGGIGAVYKEYSSNLDTTYLLNLSPFEIVALFGYSYEKEDKETYSTLLSQKTYQPAVTKWEDLRNLAGYALTEYHDDDSASVIFTDWEKMDVGKTKLLTIEMIKDNDIWKIKHIQKDSPN